MVPRLTLGGQQPRDEERLLHQPDKGNQAGGDSAGRWGAWPGREPLSGARWQFVSATAGKAQPGWDFCLGESKQGFGRVGERAGAVDQGDQGGLLLITCLSTAVKSSPRSQAHKKPHGPRPLPLSFHPLLLPLPGAFCRGAGRTDEDILDAARERLRAASICRRRL